MKKIILSLILVGAILGVLSACGSAGNFENGTSLSFHGFYQLADPEAAASADNLVGAASFVGSLAGPTSGNIWAGVTNQLYGQAVRLQRLNVSYEILGSTLAVPSTQFVSNVVLAPQSGNNGAAFGQNSTLPSGFIPDDPNDKNFPTTIYFPINILPRSITQLLSLNRNSLPARPFQIIATAYAEGVTTAGKVVKTNVFQIGGEVFNDQEGLPNLGGGGGTETDEPTESETATATLSGATGSNFEPI